MFNHHQPLQYPSGPYGAHPPTAPVFAVQGATVPVPAPIMWPATATSAPAPAALNRVAPKTNSDETAGNLHQSYLDVLNQMQMNFAAAAGPQPQQQSAPPPMPQVGAPTSALQHGAAPVASTNGASVANKPLAQSSGTSNPSARKNDEPTPALQDIPDILSGFDKVAAAQNRTTPNRADVALISSQYSPPFTSRSFDDFHQLLGNDLLHQPLNIGDSTSGGQHQAIRTSTEQVRGLPHPPIGGKSNGRADVNSDASLTADAYAMFAQESALAVSQHSAYCRTDSTPSDSGTSPTTSSGQLDTQALAAAPDVVRAPAAVSVSEESSRRFNKHNPPRYFPHPSSVVVNAANLRAHAKAAEITAELDSSSISSKNNIRRRAGVTQSYMRRNTHIVSASERSVSDLGTEESESALGSSRGGSGSSDNMSNDSDSVSDEGPCVKRQKTCRQEAHVMDTSCEVVSTVSSQQGD